MGFGERTQTDRLVSGIVVQQILGIVKAVAKSSVDSAEHLKDIYPAMNKPAFVSCCDLDVLPRRESPSDQVRGRYRGYNKQGILAERKIGTNRFKPSSRINSQ